MDKDNLNINLDQNLGFEGLQELSNQKDQKIKNLTEQMHQERKHIEILTDVIKNNKGQFDLLKKQIEDREKQIEDREKQFDLLKKQIEDQQKQIKDREKQFEDREKQIKDREKQFEDREKQILKENNELNKRVDGLEKSVSEFRKLLAKQMGNEPKSEKGSSLTNNDNTGGDNGDNGNNDDSSDSNFKDKSNSKHEERYKYAISNPREPIPEDLKNSPSRQEWFESIGSDSDLIPSKNKIFGTPVATFKNTDLKLAFSKKEKEELFDSKCLLHSKFEESSFYDFDISVELTKCKREVLTDLNTGNRFKKDKFMTMPDTQLSWASLAKISVMVAQYAFPMERLSSALGLDYFSSSNISRWFLKSAELQLAPYIALGQNLGHIGYLKTDDTSALVLEMRAEAKKGLTTDKQMTGENWDNYLDDKSDIFSKVIEDFGRVSTRSKGELPKTKVNITVVSGKLDSFDYKSMVYFYRTHFGQAGNLISRLLENRSTKSKSQIVIQGDLSSQNHVESEIASLVYIIYVGCGAHARRPFFRHRDKDRQLCFFMLRSFAILSKIETKIKLGSLTSDRVIRYRMRYSLKVWILMKNVCQTVCNEQKHQLADNQIWKKGDYVFTACQYIVSHFELLTYYLKHPEIDFDNNSSENSLRGEKLIENASHFRQSENGRIALDIHRTMIASCNSCDLPYEKFLLYIAEAGSEAVSANPEQYFPHVIAQALNNHDPPKSK